MKTPKEGTLRARILALCAANPGTAFRPPAVAEKLGVDLSVVGATMNLMCADEGDEGLLTRCRIITPGKRDGWEYRISAAAGGPAKGAPFRSYPINGNPPIPRRDEAPPAATRPETESEPVTPSAAAVPAIGTAFAQRSGAGGAARARRNPAPRKPQAHREPGAPKFRCALVSDGTMFIEAAGGSLDLDRDEARELFAYTERCELPE